MMLQRPVGLDSFTAAAAARLNPNIRFQKFVNIVKKNFWKSTPQPFAYWHIDHVSQVLWQSEKNCRSIDLK